MTQRVFSLFTSLPRKGPFGRVNFSGQFLVVSFGVLVAGMLIIGTWIGRQIETNAVRRAAATAAIYVESILATQLRGYAGGSIERDTHEALDRVFIEGPLRRSVVRFKLWDRDGHIVYSNEHGNGDHGQLGRRFEVGGLLAAAFTGTVQSRISPLDQPDNAPERKRWQELIEVYVPVYGGDYGEVTAVAEFYHSMENLGREIRAAKQRSWTLVTVATAAMYLLLLGMVRRASATILDQRRHLSRQLEQLRTAIEENDRMRGQLREAAARAAALNEQFLQRLAADLHDGPAQEIALALMRLEVLGEARSDRQAIEDDTSRDFETIYRALDASLAELRNLASGLKMPKIADLSLADTVKRAVADFEERFETTVNAEVDDALEQAPLAVRITAYRLVQESLTNGWLHARGAVQQVRARCADGYAIVEVADQGPGFVPQVAAESGRLGLAFMSERVRLLGGVLEIASEPGRGTRIRARLPLSLQETAHA